MAGSSRRCIGAGGVLAAAAVASSYALVRTGRAGPLDQAAGALVRSGPRSLDVAVSAGTDLGSVYGLAGVSVVLAACGRRRAAADVVLAGAAAWGIAQAAKPALPRSRPYDDGTAERLVAVPAGTSWPSGHAAVAAAMAAAAAPRAGVGGRVVLALSAAGVAWSRLYVGVHHLTDVLAGVGLGVLVGRTVWWWRGRCEQRTASQPAPRQLSSS